MSGGAFLEGQSLFNDGKYFEAHEEWERLWITLPQGSTDRLYVQGLIQAAGHFVHLAKGQWSGANRLAYSAIEKLLAAEGTALGRALDIEPVVGALRYNSDLLMERKLAVPVVNNPRERTKTLSLVMPSSESKMADAIPPPIPDAFLYPQLLPR